MTGWAWQEITLAGLGVLLAGVGAILSGWAAVRGCPTQTQRKRRLLMFDDVRARYALRCVLYGLAPLLVAVQAGQSWRDSLIAGVLAALAYAGVGAAVPQVEPSIGKKK